ncbi:MAG: cell division protein FtsA [Syntrophales bacterium]|jgi:cell division protein FtsA|nr:cell division protein FtsA [Syntrophales bacterium]
MGKKENVIVGLDIGTTKTCVVVAELRETGIEIMGVGTHPSEGLRKGVVVNIESTVESIKGAVEEAERSAGCEISSVYVGIAGAHIHGHNSLGIVPVKGREVRNEDVERAIEAARAIAIPLDRQILHTIPQYYLVDEQDGIIDPVGMAGVRLEAKAHIVTGAVTSIQNVIKSINRVGLEVKELVLEQLAASEAVLSNDEKALGVALIDIGGGTTDIAVFSEGSIKHTAVLPVGGQYVTSDISTGLRTPIAEAEKIKIEYGCAYMPLIAKDEMIEVPSVGGREPRNVSRQILGRIIEPRMDEILVMAQKEISRSGCEDILAAGIVLTGGGSILEGIPELAEQIFNMPVRRGLPLGIGGLTDIVNSPQYATGVGLVLYAGRNIAKQNIIRMEGNYMNRLYRRLRQWILDFF